MIEKIPNTPRINKLRIINIYEADYNLPQKQFWLRLSTKHAEATHTLDKIAWICRSESNAYNIALIAEFVNKVRRLTFNNLYKLQHDAKACFDRIINYHAMFSRRKIEVPDKISQMHSATLRNTEYRVQKTLGISTHHYKNSESDPINGNGQGAGSSGTNWVYISVPIMSILHTHEEECTIVSPDKKIKWENIMIGFVNDNWQYSNN